MNHHTACIVTGKAGTRTLTPVSATPDSRNIGVRSSGVAASLRATFLTSSDRRRESVIRGSISLQPVNPAMTLILACLTAHNVYQVSDRRLTELSDPEAVIDDERNKAVFVGRVSFGYTGLGHILSERSDNWLARVISEGETNDMAQVAERIRTAASVAFRWLRHVPPKYRRHAFQGVGWFRLKGESQLSPGIITIHNALDEQTGLWLDEPSEEFHTSTQFPSSLPGSCILNSVGVTPTAQEKGAIVRLVRKCVKHRTSTPTTVFKALIISMRWLSRRHPRIGDSLLAVSLPKQSVETWERTGRTVLLASPPNDLTATFSYVSPRGSFTWFGPHIASKGIVLTDVKAGALDESHLPPDWYGCGQVARPR
jgi:hypothetical protein